MNILVDIVILVVLRRFNWRSGETVDSETLSAAGPGVDVWGVYLCAWPRVRASAAARRGPGPGEDSCKGERCAEGECALVLFHKQ